MLYYQVSICSFNLHFSIGFYRFGATLITLILIGCFGGSSSSDDTATTDTGWHDDFEWEDGTGDQSDDTTGTDTGSGGSADTDSDTDSGGYTSPDPEDNDTETTSSTATYTVCLTVVDSDVVSLSLDGASTMGGGYVAGWIVWHDGDDLPCATLTGEQEEIFEIDGRVTLDNGTTTEFVYGPGMWDNVGELEMTDHGSSCYVYGDHENDDGVYRCRLPDIWGEP